jgi:hypothetical protein
MNTIFEKLRIVPLLLSVGMTWLSACDTFKDKQGIPLPEVETVREKSVQIVKLDYPQAKQFRLRELVKNKLWEAQYDLGSLSCASMLDDRTILFTAYQTKGNFGYYPAAISEYLNANYRLPRIVNVSKSIDQEGQLAGYLVLFHSSDGTAYGKYEGTLAFDKSGKNPVPFSRLTFKVIQTALYSTLSLPIPVLAFIQKHELGELIIEQPIIINEISDPSIKWANSKFIIGVVEINNVRHYYIRAYPTKPSLSAKYPTTMGIQYIYLTEDGKVLHWEGPSDVGITMNYKNISASELPSLAHQYINEALGIGKSEIEFVNEQYIIGLTNRYLARVKSLIDEYYYEYTFNPEGILMQGHYRFKYLMKDDIPAIFTQKLDADLPGWELNFVKSSQYSTSANINTTPITFGPLDQQRLDVVVTHNKIRYTATSSTFIGQPYTSVSIY